MAEKNCNTCKKKPLINTDYKIAMFSAFILSTSIYGTYELIKKLVSLF